MHTVRRLEPLSVNEVKMMIEVMDNHHQTTVGDLCCGEQLKVILQLADFREHTSDFWSSIDTNNTLSQPGQPHLHYTLLVESLQTLREYLHTVDDSQGVAHTIICKVFYTLMDKHQIRFFFMYCLHPLCFNPDLRFDNTHDVMPYQDNTLARPLTTPCVNCGIWSTVIDSFDTLDV